MDKITCETPKKSFTNNLLDNVEALHSNDASPLTPPSKNNMLFIYNKVYFWTGCDVMKFRRIKLKLYRRSANPERVCLGRAHPKIFILSRFAEVTSIVGFHFTLAEEIGSIFSYNLYERLLPVVYFHRRYVKLTSEQTLSKPNNFAEFGHPSAIGSSIYMLSASCLLCFRDHWQTLKEYLYLYFDVYFSN